ncbi:hypothetical protein B0T18DRAFT_398349 [Schizothecium vesticola]|uniref:Uncharacterized protein n=1 Tax=Schizothecium vesticola TaxID=314040 RepID=A0AA40FA70_9PEZI|nr:hypothetical protein B0T18DRAFT_398349 [Schizothecium vesticola]
MGRGPANLGWRGTHDGTREMDQGNNRSSQPSPAQPRRGRGREKGAKLGMPAVMWELYRSSAIC